MASDGSERVGRPRATGSKGGDGEAPNADRATSRTSQAVAVGSSPSGGQSPECACPTDRFCPLHAAAPALLAALKAVENGLLSHTTGGDPSMVFDEFDAAVEAKRHGFWTVDDSAIEVLRAAIAAAEDRA